MGHHNDCFLASITDSGTYSSDSTVRGNEYSYLDRDSKYEFVGGETCQRSNPRSYCDSQGGAVLNEMSSKYLPYQIVVKLY